MRFLILAFLLCPWAHGGGSLGLPSHSNKDSGRYARAEAEDPSSALPQKISRDLLTMKFAELSSTDFPTRDRAQKDILDMGAGVLWEPLTATAKGDADFHNRLREIIQILGKPYRLDSKAFLECVEKQVIRSKAFRPVVAALADHSCSYDTEEYKETRLKMVQSQIALEAKFARNPGQVQAAVENFLTKEMQCLPGAKVTQGVSLNSLKAIRNQMSIDVSQNGHKIRLSVERPAHVRYQPVPQNEIPLSLQPCSKPVPPLPGFTPVPPGLDRLKLKHISAVKRQNSPLLFDFDFTLENAAGENLVVESESGKPTGLGKFLLGVSVEERHRFPSYTAHGLGLALDPFRKLQLKKAPSERNVD